MSFAYYQIQRRPHWVGRRVSGLVAALSCGLVGGCIVTSEAEFPEEQQVPPVVLNTPDLPIGSVVDYDLRSQSNDVRLGISVRDDNLEDTLQVQAEITVVGQPTPNRVCPMIDIMPSGNAVREQFGLVIDRAKIRQGACNRVEVFVSREFAGTCTDRNGFAVPQLGKGDLATAIFWIWEMSGDPLSNGDGALAITNTCMRVTRAATTTSMPMSP